MALGAPLTTPVRPGLRNPRSLDSYHLRPHLHAQLVEPPILRPQGKGARCSLRGVGLGLQQATA